MSNKIEDDDKEALASMSPVPQAPRKVYSYSHQLRPGKINKTRQHSLDEDRIHKSFGFSCSSDEEFFKLEKANGDEGDAPAEPANEPPLPEFIGSGGGAGMFKNPNRSACHPGRPICLELRPHPLRETQVGKFLRTIACTETQLWAGQESGVRIWKFENAYDLGCGLGDRVRRGDEDASPFHESANTSPTMCLMMDAGNRLVWSGHKDGKIRSWKMDQTFDNSPFKEGLSWQAHRGPVLSLTMSSYGEFVSFKSPPTIYILDHCCLELCQMLISCLFSLSKWACC